MRRVALALLLAVLLMATGAYAAKDDSRIFRIGVLTDAKNLNPYFGFHGTETTVTGEVYDTLFNYDEVEKKLKGNIVSKWETKDSYTWRMTINPNFKWSDGKPLRVEDIVFTYEMIMKNKFPGQMAILATFKSVKKVDDKSFDMTFTTPAVSNLRFAGTAILIVPEHIWSAIKQPRAFANLNPVGSGPMVLKEKVDGQYIVMEVRKDHPTRKYNFDAMELIVVRDQTMGILSLRDGAFDFFDDRIPPQIAEDIKSNPGQYKNVKVDVNNTTSITTLMFNMRKAPFSDISFRKAVALSIDSDKLIKTVLMGYGTVASPSLVMSFVEWSNKAIKPIKADLAAAKKLLADAGYKDVDNDKFLEMPDGKKLKVSLLCPNAGTSMTTAEYLAYGLRSIGINAVHTPMTADALLNEYKGGQFDLGLTSMGFSEPRDMYFYYFHSSRGELGEGRVSGFNYGGFKDAEFDEVSTAMRSENDEDKQFAQLRRLQEIVAGAYYQVPVYAAYNISLYRDDRFKGWTSVEGLTILNSHTMRNLTPVK